jgi:NADH-quinone oxidoreductase subunit G
MPGAATGNSSYRTTAFENAEINGPWLCNKGYDQHQWMARARVPQPLVDGQAAAVGQALAAAKRLLGTARNPAVLVSSHASNEELDVLKSLLGAVATYAHSDCVPAADEVVEDALLIKADKNPNRRGVEERFGGQEFDPGAGHDLVLVWGEISTPLALGATPWIHLTPFGTPTQSPAAVVLPVSNTYERRGSFTNFEGKRNTFEQVFEKPAQVQHAVDVFRSLAS